MKIEILKMYIDTAVMLSDLKDPSYEEICYSIKKHFNVDVTVEELENFYLSEVQDKLAQLKAWGINY